MWLRAFAGPGLRADAAVAADRAAFVARAGVTTATASDAAKRTKFFDDVQATRARINNVSRTTLNPRSTFIQLWDLLTLSALIFTALVTPFELSLIHI